MKLLNGLFILLALPFAAAAQGSPVLSEDGRSIRIVGRNDATVTEANVSLADIADVMSLRVADDDAVMMLRKISITKSPSPGETINVSGETVVERLKSAGVNLDKVIYSLPRSTSVKRAYREVGLAEIERALRGLLDGSGKDVELRNVDYREPMKVPPGAPPVEAVALKTTQPGHIGFDIRSSADSEEVRFSLKATVDEWVKIPVAARVIAKGSVISASDLELIRMNSASLGRDVLSDLHGVLGNEATRDVGAGEMFRNGSVRAPLIVSANSKVTMVYRSSGLEASAAGIAMQDGGTNEVIRVKNESSKRVVEARVLQSGLVEVLP